MIPEKKLQSRQRNRGAHTCTCPHGQTGLRDVHPPLCARQPINSFTCVHLYTRLRLSASYTCTPRPAAPRRRVAPCYECGLYCRYVAVLATTALSPITRRSPAERDTLSLPNSCNDRKFTPGLLAAWRNNGGPDPRHPTMRLQRHVTRDAAQCGQMLVFWRRLDNFKSMSDASKCFWRKV